MWSGGGVSGLMTLLREKELEGQPGSMQGSVSRGFYGNAQPVGLGHVFVLVGGVVCWLDSWLAHHI